jgi:5-methylcytosine-specific restriction endonuclease McrA
VPVCTTCLGPRTAERYRAKCRRRRTLKLGGLIEKYTLAEIAERDGRQCGLCRQPVDMTVRNPDPWAPTIDHIVPVSLGGADVRANVWLAHRVCNLRKGNRVPVEAPASL